MAQEFDQQISEFEQPELESLAPPIANPEDIQPSGEPEDIEEVELFDLTDEEDKELERLPPALAAKIRQQKELLFNRRQSVEDRKQAAKERGQARSETLQAQARAFDEQARQANEVAKRQNDQLEMLKQDQQREMASIERGQDAWNNKSALKTGILSAVSLISILAKGKRDPAAAQRIVALMNNEIEKDDREGIRRRTLKQQGIQQQQQIIDRLSSSEQVAQQQARALKMKAFEVQLQQHRDNERDAQVIEQYDQVLDAIKAEFQNTTQKAIAQAQEEGRKRVKEELDLEKGLVDIQAKRAGIETAKTKARADRRKLKQEEVKLAIAKRKEERAEDELTIPSATDVDGKPIKVTSAAAAREFNKQFSDFAEQNQVAQNLFEEVDQLGNTAKLGDRFTLKGEKLKQLYGTLRRTLTKAGGAALSESEVKEILAPLGGGKIPIRVSLFKQQLRLFQRLNKQKAISRLKPGTRQKIKDINFGTVETRKAPPRKAEKLAAEINAAEIRKEAGVVFAGNNPVARRRGSAENKKLRSNITNLDKLAKAGNTQAKRLLKKILEGEKGDFARKVLKGE